ncbi:MAG: GCN5-related N-acetyltransferase, partial [Pacificimonas sp.]
MRRFCLPGVRSDMMREELEDEWLTLTKKKLPALAASQDWPVRFDHCFQRILLDNACGGVWYDDIEGRPAYREADEDLLRRALEIGNAAIDGRTDMVALNR